MTGVLEWAIGLTYGLLLLGMGCAFLRLMRGPSLPDRVVALEYIMVLTVAFAAVYAIETERAAFLDVAVALALALFLATVAFARYVERRHDPMPAERPRAEDTSG
jgi:multicomponent Na+:H+ antiporter subunit F